MINNDKYYKKYLKYKSKYVELKGQIGGTCPSSSNGYSKVQLIKLGCTKDKFEISSITKKEIIDHNKETIKTENRITTYELNNAGFTVDILKRLGFTVDELKNME